MPQNYRILQFHLKYLIFFCKTITIYTDINIAQCFLSEVCNFFRVQAEGCPKRKRNVQKDGFYDKIKQISR